MLGGMRYTESALGAARELIEGAVAWQQEQKKTKGA